jgi:thiol-disulfide isomerase/thioredoxin
MNFITNEEELKFGKKPTALYFYANWMPFHKKMITMIEKVETKYMVDFLAIDADIFKNICKRFSVESIPLVIIYKNKYEVSRISGLPMTSAFLSAFKEMERK